MTWDPERRARLERGEQKIDGFDPLGTILVRQDDLAAALAEIDRLSAPTWHDQTLSDLAQENRRQATRIEVLEGLLQLADRIAEKTREITVSLSPPGVDP